MEGTHLDLISKCIENRRRILGDRGIVVKDPEHAIEGQPIFHATALAGCTTNRWPLNEARGATLKINSENDLVDTLPPMAGTAKSSSNTPVAVGAS